MGRGNVCTTGAYEGLYYIDNDHFHMYGRFDEKDELHECALMGELSCDELAGADGWQFDDLGTEMELDDIIDCFVDSFTDSFHSFERCAPGTWLRSGGPIGGDCKKVILENGLFYICMEDNEWSMAVELIQKEDPYDDHLKGLQKRHYEKYLEGIKKALLKRLPSIATRNGAWCSGVIRREDVYAV